MKRIWIVALVGALGLALVGTAAYAGCGMGYGYGPGAYGYGAGSGKQVDVNAFRAFQKETLPLRDEMMAKRVELMNEYGKEKPDQNRVATIQKEMIDLRIKISAAAEKQGLPTTGFGQGMGGRGVGHGARMARDGNFGPGSGGRGWGGQGFGGRGPGSGNCPMW
jgi:zinc resistance-associated protein